MCSSRVAERGQYGHKHRAPTGLERAFIMLKVIQYFAAFSVLCLKSISGNVSVFSFALVNNCSCSPTGTAATDAQNHLPVSPRQPEWRHFLPAGHRPEKEGWCTSPLEPAPLRNTQRQRQRHINAPSVLVHVCVNRWAARAQNKLGNTFINHLIDRPVAFVRYVQIEILQEQ